MTSSERPSFLVAGATGVVGGALLVAGEPVWALFCGALALATGGWANLRRRDGVEPGTRPSLWAAARLGCPETVPGWRRRRAKFLARALLRRRTTAAWVGRVSRPDVSPLWAARPRLASKLQRAYLRADWRVGAVLDALKSHYDILRELISAPVRARVYGQGLTLLRVVGASGQAADLRLVYRDQFEKEGELTVTLEDAATGLLLSSITFCLTDGPEGRTAWIGGLQSAADPRTRALIQEWTKAMHGLRPKGLVLWALRQLCTPWQIGRLRAAADDRHVHRHWRRRRSIHARYDEFWAESGGVRDAAGEWDLPLSVPERPREELKPSRRKAHEQRYAMLADLRAELLAANASVAPDADPGESAALPRLFRI
jgi:uncharacterized protein VirK/YbjX